MKPNLSLSVTSRAVFALVAVTVAACSSAAPPPKEPPATTEVAPETTAPVDDAKEVADPGKGPQHKAGPGGFPLPQDATKDDQKSVGPIEVFVIERGKDKAIEELRALLEADGWKIESEEPSPSNASLRFVVSKDGKTFKASVTGDEGKAAFIVTPPKQ